jgi:hypothetical protein
VGMRLVRTAELTHSGSQDGIGVCTFTASITWHLGFKRQGCATAKAPQGASAVRVPNTVDRTSPVLPANVGARSALSLAIAGELRARGTGALRREAVLQGLATAGVAPSGDTHRSGLHGPGGPGSSWGPAGVEDP